MVYLQNVYNSRHFAKFQGYSDHMVWPSKTLFLACSNTLFLLTPNPDLLHQNAHWSWWFTCLFWVLVREFAQNISSHKCYWSLFLCFLSVFLLSPFQIEPGSIFFWNTNRTNSLNASVWLHSPMELPEVPAVAFSPRPSSQKHYLGLNMLYSGWVSALLTLITNSYRFVPGCFFFRILYHQLSSNFKIYYF